MSESENRKWLSEYEVFLQSDEIEVPEHLTDRVLSRMQDLVKPSAWQVFAKVLGLHGVIGFLSLSVCHQFGINPFGTESSLDGWFMSMWSHGTCMIVCGLLFIGLSFLSAGAFLSIEEARALRRTEFVQTLALGLLSLGIFAAFGAELALTFAGLWLLGALLGGFLATEVVWKIKRASVTSA